MKRLICVAIMSLLFFSCGKREAEPKAETEIKKEGPAAHPDKYIEEANVVELSLEGQRRAGIVVAPLTMGSIDERVVLTGTVQPMDSHLTQIHPLARGRITQVAVKAGDRISAGQALASFDNIEAGELTAQIAAARAELARSKVQLAQAKRQAERSRSLVDIGAVPAKESEAAEAEVAALSEAIRAQEATIAGIGTRLTRFGATVDVGVSNSITSIRSPFNGVVIRVDAGPGAVVDPTTVLMSVADLSRVYVEAQVFEKDLGRIKVGQSTQVSFEAYPNDSFQGRIVSIKDTLDPQTRTAGVRVELPNPAGKLRLEMFATIELPTTGTHSALTIPTESVQTVNKRQVVFVKQDSLHFAAREVRTAGDGLTREVVSGLKEGESVVVKGAYQLKSVFLSKEMQGEHEHD